MIEHIEKFCERYLVVEELAIGHFSRTLLARDLELPGYPFCIIKCSTPDAGNQSGNAAALKHQVIRQEALILARLKDSSANIPRLLTYPEYHHPPYFVEEYIKGDLIEHLKQKPFNATQIMAFLQNALSVLDIVHRHDVVHQDVKPANLIQRTNGMIALIDFGAAIDIDEFMESDSIYGTPGYSPPEQQDGKVGFHTDLYALGMTAIELLTGIPPQHFERHPTSGQLNWQTKLKDDTLDRELRAILDRMVALRPADRYQSAINVLADLQQLKVHARLSALQTQIRNSPLRSLAQLSSRISSQFRPVSLSQSIASPVIVALSVVCGFGFVPLLPRMTDTIAAQVSSIQAQPSFDLTLAHDIVLPHEIDQFLIASKLVTFSRDHQIQVWDLPTAKVQQSWTTPEEIEMLAINDNQLVSQSRTGTISIWQLATGGLMRQIKSSEPAKAASLSPDGRYLATVSASRTLRIWNLQTGDLIRTVDGITAIHYAPNNLLLCATSDLRIDVWDAAYSQVQKALVGHIRDIREIAVSADSEWLASTGDDGTLIWKLSTAELVQVIPPTSKVSTAAKITSYLVTQHQDGSLRLWNSSGQLMKPLAYLKTKVAMSPNARQVVSVDAKHLQFWQLSEAKL